MTFVIMNVCKLQKRIYRFIIQRYRQRNISYKNKDPFEFLTNDKDLFDLLNYDENHELYDTSNNDVIGKLKKERPNNQIIEFI